MEKESLEKKENGTDTLQKENQAAQTAQTGEKKKQKISKPRLILAILLILAALGAVYFIQSEDQLDAAMEEKNYSKALSCMHRMPWISWTDANLEVYLEAQLLAEQGDEAAAAAAFQKIGGYRDSTELCLVYATISRAKDLSLSANPDELLAGYEKMKELSASNSDEDSLVLYRQRMYDAACQWMKEKPEDTLRVLKAIPEHPQAAETQKVAEISRNFNISGNDEIYEETMAALKPLAKNPEAGKLLVSEHFINAFLEGRWETEDGACYYEHTVFSLKNGTGQHKTNLPHPAMVGSEYTDGRLLMQKTEESELEELYRFEVVDYDTIRVENCYDAQNYTLHRTKEE